MNSKSLNRNAGGLRVLDATGLETKSLSNAAFDFQQLADVNAILFQDEKMNKYGTHPLKSSNSKHSFGKSGRDLKISPSGFAESSKHSKKKSGNGRSKSSDSRASPKVILNEQNGLEIEDRIYLLGEGLKDVKPPLPPRTDKMPKDYRPPVPPKLHKLPIARNSLKEKLKNNLKLELKVPPSHGPNHNKKAKFKVKLMQRAQQFRGASKNKKAKNNANSDVVLLKYRRLEPSLSMPYNLGANTPGGGESVCDIDEEPMRHSQSTLSMPSFLWDVASSSSPGVAESLPDLLASDSETSSESQVTHSYPAKRNPPTLSNVEVGLVSASDHALLHVGKGKMESNLGPVKALQQPGPSPIKNKKSLLKCSVGKHDSSSNSDITSEQSGWVSNSSRQSSGSSSGQVSPDLEVKKLPVSPSLLPSTPYKVNGKISTHSSPVTYPIVKSKSLSKKSSPAISKSSHKEPKSLKENALRSASNDHLQLSRKKSPSKKEVKKSKSLQKVNNSPKTVYGQVPLPPPPKEFQDPHPGSKKSFIKEGGFGTTGKLPREERITRLVAQNSKDRPRSESPRTETSIIRNGIEGSDKNRVYWTANSKLTTTFDLEDIASVEESLSEVLSEVKNNLNRKSRTRDKFNSLPSMRRRRHQSAGASSKKSNKKKPSTPDHLSDSVNNFGLSSTLDRGRTHSAPTSQLTKSETSGKEVKFKRRSEPITNKNIDPLAYLPENKASLLEMFLEQQEATVWGDQKDVQRSLLQNSQRTSSKMNLKKKEHSKPSREKSRSQPDLNDAISKIPPPPKPPSPW